MELIHLSDSAFRVADGDFTDYAIEEYNNEKLVVRVTKEVKDLYTVARHLVGVYPKLLSYFGVSKVSFIANEVTCNVSASDTALQVYNKYKHSVQNS